ncbi:transmembrane and ubiquitin-like domain-containing protein 2 [Sabethes cyaneus]|uniref:transmembrane and ubiquitin-like domain-containing protein 2 n=1 Tax=Sabethes cyaneus TaxID=53552 RepID=UPI00237EAA5D|nr:transmembrane and ubiquitin-like domain-containing protein 2 [Sabethes cyaneus]XP_053695770.1 transmembrane and ubiquitin-like domain-containing protein 2 [Sabethes cyaneus]
MLPLLKDTDEILSPLTIGLLALIIVYFAWRSTYVRDDRPNSQGTVLVIENNLRRLNHITQEPVTINILRSSSQQSNISNVTETEELDLENDSIASSIDNITQSILTEASESATGLDISDSETYPSTSITRNNLDDIDSGPEEIIRQMDHHDSDDHISTAPQEQITSTSFAGIDGVRQQVNTQGCDTKSIGSNGEQNESRPTKETLQSKRIRIKLKYLNDDSRLVEGDLTEKVGDFKKRNFSIELAAKKLVRLVFNGHVLQPDSKTLAACGLFDNCVVHCLIHNPKPQLSSIEANESSTNPIRDTEGTGNGIPNAVNPDGVGFRSMDRDNWTRYGTYFIYIGTFILSATISYCWYCRFHYGHLFNLNSTIGLIVTTTIFLIMMPTIILTESHSAN